MLMRETLHQITEEAGHQVGFDDEEIRRQQEPDHVYPYETEHGALVVRTVHRGFSNGNGYSYSGGGFRVEVIPDDQGLDVEEALSNSAALAENQTKKNLLAGLKEGGAKADAFVPESVYKDQRRFYEVLESFVGQHITLIRRGDRIGPDMKMGEDEMDHMARKAVILNGDPHDATWFTGKSLEKGGAPGRSDATSRGLVVATNVLLEAEGLGDLRGKTMAIEGGGNVGSHLYRLAHEAGAYVLGISDVNRAVVAHELSGQGLYGSDVQFKNRGIGSFNQDRARSSNNPQDLLDLDVDLFVFAGPSHSVTASKRNLPRLRSKRAVFGANTPFDFNAILQFLAEGGIIYADPTVNSGGVIGSNVESDMNGASTLELVHHEIDTRVARANRRVAQEATNSSGVVDPSDFFWAANRLAARDLYARDHHLLAV